jgi:hypothetical protein
MIDLHFAPTSGPGPAMGAACPAAMPAPSRRVVSPAMAARGLRSVAELAEGKPCGTRIRYYAGCRCDECRAAIVAYGRERKAARERGETNRLVSAVRAQAHLRWLSQRGVGAKMAADAAKVAASTVSAIAGGQKRKIRQQTERRILAVTEVAAADGSRRSARETWRMLDELIASGYARARLATEILGHRTPCLQISRHRVRLSTEAAVRRVYERWRMASPRDLAKAQALLTDLRQEGFRPARIQSEVDRLAAARGWSPASITPRRAGGRWPGPVGLTHQAVVLITAAHAALMGV